jgi:hypothetical protein
MILFTNPEQIPGSNLLPDRRSPKPTPSPPPTRRFNRRLNVTGPPTKMFSTIVEVNDKICGLSLQKGVERRCRQRH